jgi:hypothetical protein
MKRPILYLLGTAALATGGLLAAAGAAHADSSNGNRFHYIHQHTTTICGNAIAIDAVVRNHCGAYTPADLDSIDGMFHLDLDYDGSDVSDDAGRWFHVDSRTWS